MEKKGKGRRHIKLTCENPTCRKKYSKVLSEYNRNKKIVGRKSYCSIRCSAKQNHERLNKWKGITTHLNPSNKKDEYTPFREHLRRVQRRDQEANITLENLKEQWEKQNGTCPYTNVELVHPRNQGKGRVPISKIYLASLDRVDSKIGYMKGNIQFTSAMANFAKNDESADTMLEFCRLIAESWK